MAEVTSLTGTVTYVYDKNDVGFVFGPVDGDETDWPFPPKKDKKGVYQDSRWFTVGKDYNTQRLMCKRPPQGAVITISYSVSPPKDGYDEGYWLHSWKSVNEDSDHGAGYEHQDAPPESAPENPEPVKRTSAELNLEREAMKNSSMERMSCLRGAVDFWSEREIKATDGEVEIGIEDQRVIRTARFYYKQMFSSDSQYVDTTEAPKAAPEPQDHGGDPGYLDEHPTDGQA